MKCGHFLIHTFILGTIKCLDVQKKRIIFAAVSIFTLYLNTVSLRAQSTLIGQLSQARGRRRPLTDVWMARLKGTDSQCGLCTC